MTCPGYILCRIMWVPCWGWRVKIMWGACVYNGESSKEKRCRIIAVAIFASNMAKFCPTQIRGPHPNGKYKPGFFCAFVTPSLNLSGLNSIASSPHTSWSWCNKTVGNETCVPAGSNSSPNFVSFWICRESAGTGGYSLMTSYKIMVSCDEEHVRNTVTTINLRV